MSAKRVVLTPYLIRILRLQIRIGSMFHGIPFAWEPNEFMPRVDESPHNLLKYSIILIFWPVFLIFECFRAYQGYFDEKGSSLGKFYGLCIAVGYVANIPSMFMFAFRRHEFILSIQQAMLLVSGFQEERLFYTGQKSARNLDLILLGFSITVGFNGGAVAVLASFLPHNPISPASLLYDFAQGEWIIANFWILSAIWVLNACIGTYFAYVTATTFVVFGSMIISFFELCVAILQEMRIPKLNLDMNRHLKTFEEIMILMVHFSNTCGILFGCIQWLIVILVVLSFYSAVKVGGVVAVILGCMGISVMAMFVIVYSKAAKVGEESFLLIGAWKHGGQKRPLLVEQKIRFLRPLWIRLGNMYYFDNHLVLRACSIIVELTVNALLVV